jgi:hypothetical protein
VYESREWWTWLTWHPMRMVAVAGVRRYMSFTIRGQSTREFASAEYIIDVFRRKLVFPGHAIPCSVGVPLCTWGMIFVCPALSAHPSRAPSYRALRLGDEHLIVCHG